MLDPVMNNADVQFHTTTEIKQRMAFNKRKINYLQKILQIIFKQKHKSYNTLYVHPHKSLTIKSFTSSQRISNLNPRDEFCIYFRLTKSEFSYSDNNSSH